MTIVKQDGAAAQHTLALGSKVVAELTAPMVPVAGLTPLQRWTAAFETAEYLGLTIGAAATFNRLCWHDATSSHSTASAAHLASKTRFSRPSVVRGLAELADFGLVVAKRRGQGKTAVRTVSVPKPVYERVLEVTEKAAGEIRQKPADSQKAQTESSRRLRLSRLDDSQRATNQELEQGRGTTPPPPTEGPARPANLAGSGGGGVPESAEQEDHEEVAALKALLAASGVNASLLTVAHFEACDVVGFVNWATGADGGAGMAAKGNAQSVLKAIEGRFNAARPKAPEKRTAPRADPEPDVRRCVDCKVEVEAGQTVCAECHAKFIRDSALWSDNQRRRQQHG